MLKGGPIFKDSLPVLTNRRPLFLQLSQIELAIFVRRLILLIFCLGYNFNFEPYHYAAMTGDYAFLQQL